MDHNGKDRGRMKRRGVDGNIKKKRIYLITAVPLYVHGHPHQRTSLLLRPQRTHC